VLMLEWCQQYDALACENASALWSDVSV
jgi:hypothetical protein